MSVHLLAQTEVQSWTRMCPESGYVGGASVLFRSEGLRRSVNRAIADSRRILRN